MAEYVSNRKNGYKVVKRYKRNGMVKLLSQYGLEFKVSLDKLVANGYRFQSTKPACMGRVVSERK